MSCKHRVRRLARTVQWCSRCGAHRRQKPDECWTRWIPCGVERLPPLSAAERQTVLDLGSMEAVAALEALRKSFDKVFRGDAPPQLELPHSSPQRHTLRVVKGKGDTGDAT